VALEPGAARGFQNVGYVAAATAAVSLLLAGLLKPAAADASPLDATDEDAPEVEPAVT
jgi:MFS transporter, DHA1 family, inner membrane transport protein